MLVDTINAKKILETCPHYDEIINFDFDYDDEITIDLIDWYKDLIFSCNGDDDNETMGAELFSRRSVRMNPVFRPRFPCSYS